MKKVFLVGFFILSILFLGYALALGNTLTPVYGPQPENLSNTSKYDSITIANWNLQIFGPTKASNPQIMNAYANIIDDYDIVFVQEIRNADQTAFAALCSLLPGHGCEVSSRAGRSSSKEQYGIIYKRHIGLKKMFDYNPDIQDRWERPPIAVHFNAKGYSFTVYNIHTKPSDTPNEIEELEAIMPSNGNLIVVGDLNADCSYYDRSVENDFANWHWVIPDSADTTVSSTDCAYDRIIMNGNAYGEYLDHGIRTQNITSTLSDHYLVWVEVEI